MKKTTFFLDDKTRELVDEYCKQQNVRLSEAI